ncbi:unnamed protein product [Durusdinium trenchii]|uniref:Uncharacterized protein n=1 Tax=Durusdinium trenchii TaxID=1381693 RepID=A0ABP0R903_9DINO
MDLLPGPRPAWDLTSHDLLHMTYLQKAHVFTYDRCCRVPFTEISQMLLSRWPALARAQERWPARLKSTRRGRWRWRALADLAAQQLERAGRKVNDGDFISAVAELLVFYTWRLRANRAAASRDFDRSSRTVELRTWRRLRRAMEAQRAGPFEACACAGKGYDMLMAMRDNIKRLWLHHANFSKFLTTPSEPAHYLSILQSCANEEVSAHALVYFQQTSLQTNCVSGDVASNIAVAQACILQGRWDRAADLLLLAFALVVLAPWRDCLSLSFWDITADDVVYNAARLASMSSNNAKQRPHLDAPAAVQLLAWRRPEGTALLPRHLTRRAQCFGPARLKQGVCLNAGKILVPQWFGSAVRAALCTEFGALDGESLVQEIDWNQWISRRTWSSTSDAELVPTEPTTAECSDVPVSSEPRGFSSRENQINKTDS